MRAQMRIAVAACLVLAGCGDGEAIGPGQGPGAASGAQTAAAATKDPPKAPPCRGMPAATRHLPAATFRTNDVPADQWPRDYGLPLVIKMDDPAVPEGIQGPSPPIPEEPER